MKKGIFIAIVFLGIISAVFAVLGPLHEIWHWIVATLSGVHATMGWGMTYMNLSEATLPIAFAGIFGESLTLTLIFLTLIYKGYYKLAAYILGYTISFILIIIVTPLGFVMLDIEVALTVAPATTVYAIYYTWVIYYFILLFIQVGTLIANSRVFFGKKEIIVANKSKISNKTLTPA